MGEVNFSNHALERWIEYGGRISKEEAFVKSVFIGTDLYEASECEYYIWEDKIFVFNPKSRVIVTIVNVNYGLPSQNKQIIARQTRLVLKLLDKADTLETRHKLKEKESDIIIQGCEKKMNALKHQIEALQHQINGQMELCTAYRKDYESAQKEHRAELYRLHYSINTRVPDPNRRRR